MADHDPPPGGEDPTELSETDLGNTGGARRHGRRLRGAPDLAQPPRRPEGPAAGPSV